MSAEFDKLKEDNFMKWLENEDLDVDFDMFAVDSKDYAFLQQFNKTLFVTSAGGLYPFQAEGYIEGLNFYYREDDDWASLKVSPSKDELYLTPYYAASKKIETVNGKHVHWVSSFLDLVMMLEKSPFCYSFPTGVIEYNEEDYTKSFVKYSYDSENWDRFSIIVQWGSSLEEALEKAKIFSVSEYLSSRGWSVEKQEFYHNLRVLSMSETPLECDNRDFNGLPEKFELHLPELWLDEDKVNYPWDK